MSRNITNTPTKIFVNTVSAREPLELLTPSDTSSTMTLKGLNGFGSANQLIKVNSNADGLEYVNNFQGTAPITITGSTISYDISGLTDATLALSDTVFVQQGANLRKTTFTNIKTLLGVPDITTATAFASSATGIITLGNSQGTAATASLEFYGTSFSLKNTSNVNVATFTPSSNTCNLDLNGGLLTKFTASTNAVWNGGVIGNIYGGTGQSTYTTGDLLYSSATNTLSKLNIGSANQFLIVGASGIPSWSAIPASIYTTNTTPKTSDFLLLKDDTTDTYEKSTITDFINQFQEAINYGGLLPIVKDTSNVYYKFDLFNLTNQSLVGNTATFFISSTGFNADYKKLTFANLQTSLVVNGILTDNIYFGTDSTVVGSRQFGISNRNSLLTGDSTFINGNTDLQFQVLSSNKFTINTSTTNFNTQYVVVNGDGTNTANLKLNTADAALIGYNDRPYIGRDNVNGYIYVGNSTDSTDLFSTTTYAKTIDLSVGLDSTGDFNIKAQGERRVKITGSGDRYILMGRRAESTATAEVAVHICNNSLSGWQESRLMLESRTNSQPSVIQLYTNSGTDSSTRYANFIFTDYQGSLYFNTYASNVRNQVVINQQSFITNRNHYIADLGTYGLEYHNTSDIFSTSTKSWRSQVPSSTGNLTFDYRTSYTSGWSGKGYVANSVSSYTQMNFTSQHRCIPEEEKLYDNVDNYIGMVVEATGQYNSIMFEEVEEDVMLIDNVKEEVDMATNTIIKEAYVKEIPSKQKHINNITKNEPTINESQPIVRLTTTAKSKKVYGVISNKEDSQDGKRIYGDGAFVSIVSDLNDNRLFINSGGEGGILVCNENGNIENGDYLCSSSITGIAMKQDDDILHNYTIAKATMDYNFVDADERKLIGCTYHCG